MQSETLPENTFRSATSARAAWAGHNTTLLAVYDGSDTLVARFEYGVGRMPVRMTQDSETYYFAYDQVGSLRAVFDDAGVLVHEITYDSYGNIITDETTSGFGSVYIPPFGFAGGLHDRDTGMVLFGFRDYDPETGTWLTPDPIGFAGGDTYLYGYCGGDPVNFSDPVGLCGINTGSGLPWWNPYGWNVPGPYGSADPSEWGSFSNPGSWNNIFSGPQQGTGWGTAQIASVGVASAMAGGALALGGIELAFLGNASIPLPGIMSTAYAAPLGTPAAPYHQRIVDRIQQTPTDVFHNFPASFDSVILRAQPTLHRVDELRYAVTGYINGTCGEYVMLINKAGEIFHRQFHEFK